MRPAARMPTKAADQRPTETRAAPRGSQDGREALFSGMCRNIKTLANFEPPATDDEIRASALQFVRKLSGAPKPSHANEAVFNRAVEEVTAAAHRLVHGLQTNAPPRDRDEERRKAHERALKRFGPRRSTASS